jgi:nicotinate-nucleotide adenylyltransferase
MVRLAVEGHEGITASGLELDLPRPNYTADSLRWMRERWPEHTFDLIIGSDNLASFHHWKEPEEILSHHRMLVYPRDGIQGHLAEAQYLAHPQVEVIDDAPLLPNASTGIRESILAGSNVEDTVSPEVLAYIRQHGLYTS